MDSLKITKIKLSLWLIMQHHVWESASAVQYYHELLTSILDGVKYLRFKIQPLYSGIDSEPLVPKNAVTDS
jgi:hypothetical protein